jgi:hypothetical protein
MPAAPPAHPPRYAVVWNLRDGRRVAGSLEVLPDRVRLDGRAGDGRRCVYELAYGSITAVRIGRVHSERMDGRPALVLESRDTGPLLIGDVDQPGALQELAERLSAPAGGTRG